MFRLYRNRNWKSGTVSFAAFLLAVLTVLVLTPLFQPGSFIDANLYKTVAANFNEPPTAFWTMKFTNTSMRFFCEQPPLYLFLLGGFYKCFGLNLFSDRLFTLLHLLLFLYLLFAVCKKLFKERARFFFLLNLFFLLSIQVLCWTFAQQVIESLVLVFAVLALYLYLLYLEKPKAFLIVLFVFTVLLLFLTKGFQSCFVLVLPLSDALFSGFEKHKLRFALVSLFASVLCLTALLYYYEPAANWFNCYVKARLVLTLNNIGATTSRRTDLLLEAMVQNSLLLLCFMLLYSVLKRRKAWVAMVSSERGLSLSLLLTALAGILPFMLSLVQRAFYPVPAYPFLVLFFTFAFRENWWMAWQPLEKLLQKSSLRLVMYGVLGASIVYSLLMLPRHKREKTLEEDVEKISVFFSYGDTLRIHPELWNNFNLHALLYMKKKVSLNAETSSKGFLLLPQGKTPPKQIKTLHKLQLPTKEFHLYWIQEE